MTDDYENKFYEILYDRDGAPIKVLKGKIEPENNGKTDWKDYDTSHGHCGLCGRLNCNGRCFR